MKFQIELKSGIVGSDVAEIAIRAGDHSVTRLFRPGNVAASDFLQAPPQQLAEWLIENWWRLRWEPIPARVASIEGIDPSWRLAHDLRSIGSEYAWPRTIIWGQDSRVGIRAEPAPIGAVEPVRFVADVSVFVPAGEFEQGVDSFLEAVDTKSKVVTDTLNQLKGERADPDVAAWRRLEARLGYDPDHVPQVLMEMLARFSGHFGQHDVEEAASAQPGQGAGATLQEAVERAKTSAAFVCRCELQAAAEAAAVIAKDEIPWQRGEKLAASVRDQIGKQGPLTDVDLGNVLNVPESAFADSSGTGLKYAIRLATNGEERVLPRSKYRTGRRFEFARAFGDALAYGLDRPDSLGPIARSMTERQQLQRSFAQSLLCPFSELMAYVNYGKPDDEDIEAASQYFGVSPRVVQTTLVNHQVISRPEFEALAEAS